ncbi:MAG: hypothetical protein AAF688_11975 [Bacteroidota bacterium]
MFKIHKQIPLLLFLMVCPIILHAQSKSEERLKEEYEEKVEKNKQDFISDFLKTLEVDDFQKEIISQTMDSYFDELQKLQKTGLRPYEAKDAVRKMRESHFSDVKAIVTEETMNKIEDALTGKWNPKDEKKKKRKRRKNKDKDN